ncbi:LamG-like jellyroll fold domain-containing protein [Jidongwangia harbinensis]|uniref:LamG-like jellyroll fold domain-containing protein n=1 Tax=Jidongwangia harbinensis TaxID=2878561 RepID=UPI001CD992ED|nr:LamG-like jellyroll fold domain-containing protein [Jidongwangia harbinensis]MCA2214401.1 LamG domain-containing protein [Jidongwangia harbinensis]
MRSPAYLLAAALAVTLVAPPTAAHAAVAPRSAAIVSQFPIEVALPVTVAWYGFDGARFTPVLDGTGRGHTMRLVTRYGGTIRPILHGAGMGIRFPRKCAGSRCPKAVLQSPHAADLNPGVRPFTYGATVRLAPSQTTSGQNVLQKGFSATGSQYKLQIDGRAGRPSCVLVGTRTGIKLVRSAVTVADGIWHTVQCRRIGTVFRILVDGVVRGQIAVPASLSVVNGRPLSIGGKGVYPDNDQFQGHLDNVYVQVG